MKNHLRALIFFLQIFIISCTSVALLCQYEDSPKGVISEAKRATKGFVLPDDRELAKIAEVTKNLILGMSEDPTLIDKAHQLASDLGFEIKTINHSSGSYIVLREEIEKGKHGSGDGIYIFRNLKQIKGKRVVIIQSPHSIYETSTSYISRSVFEKTDAFALFVNTIHRYSTEKNGKYESDVAHNQKSYFYSITKVLCDHFESALVIQFHGYDSSKHPDVDGNISVILSDGKDHHRKSTDFRRIVQRFMGLLGEDKVGIFGVNCHELGGTYNVQGDYINSRSDDTFIHVELSEKLRREFTRNKHLRTGFISIFQ
jgi:hypothetical protein